METLCSIRDFISSYHFPYFHVVVKKDHEIIFEYGENKEQPFAGEETLFMYSMSKPITATVVMKLIEQGKIKISDPVSLYLENYEHLSIRRSDGSIVPAKKEMTIEHLLSMRSGLTYNLWSENLSRLKNPTTVEAMNELAKDPLIFEPGEGFEYSLSYDVLAAVIEKVAGKPFSQVVQELVFNPLGMKQTTFQNSLHLASCLPEYKFEDGIYQKTENLIPCFLFNGERYECGGAGLVSSVHDYAKFADALACGVSSDGVRVIGEDSILNMRTARTPDMCSVGDYSIDKKGYGYGLSVRVANTPNGRVGKNEFGWDGACGCFCLMDPDKHVSIVMGLTIHDWPPILGDFHHVLAEKIYEALGL